MSSKETPTSSAGPSGSPPAQVVPVDLATKSSSSAAPSVAQIRIPTVSSMKPALITRPGAGVSPGLRAAVVTKPAPAANITMITPGKVVVPLTSPRPVSQPGATVTQVSRAAVATPILRGVTPVTLRAPLQPGNTLPPGSIRLASPVSGSAVHLIQSSGGSSGSKVTVAQPGQGRTVLPVSAPAARPAMAAVSFRPSGPLVTTARPTLSPTGGATAVVPTSVTKTIVTQNPAGVFKPITTQVSVTGAPVALKPSPVSGGGLPVRVPAAAQRVTVVTQPLAVSLSQTQTHIQVPMVPAAVGPPKTRVAGGAGAGMKVVSGVSLAPVQLTSAAPAGARTIQLPNSGPGSKTGANVTTNIPVARVIPQQQSGAGFVALVGAGGQGQSQASPVNLSVSRATVAAPAMAIPNFSSAKLMTYDNRAEQSSVTITTLPAVAQDNTSSHAPAPATITPARITPINPPAVSDDKQVPGSPRPSILRKRPDNSDQVTPVKGQAILTSPPPRPESSGSSTISATSTLPGLSGDEHPQPAPASIEPSPRKRARKQQLPPREANTNVSPEWASVKTQIGVRDRLDWNTRPEADWAGKVRDWNTETGDSWDPDMAPDQADDEEEMSTDDEKDKPLGSFIRGKPQVSLLHSYRHTWKSRHNHFLRYTDVKSKDERRPTVNELANQKLVLQKINGWKIYHVSHGMEEVVDMENELSDKLEDFAQRLEDAAHKDIDKEMTKVQELIKANIQRSKVIQDQVSEAKDNCQSIFEHKPKIQDIILKYQSKRDRISKGRRDN